MSHHPRPRRSLACNCQPRSPPYTPSLPVQQRLGEQPGRLGAGQGDWATTMAPMRSRVALSHAHPPPPDRAPGAHGRPHLPAALPHPGCVVVSAGRRSVARRVRDWVDMARPSPAMTGERARGDRPRPRHTAPVHRILTPRPYGPPSPHRSAPCPPPRPSPRRPTASPPSSPCWQAASPNRAVSPASPTRW